MRTHIIICLLLLGMSVGIAGQSSTNNPPPSGMFVRSFTVSTNAFPKMRTSIKAKADQSDYEVLLNYCRSKGVELSSPSRAFYTRREQSLVVRSTWENLNKLDVILSEREPPK